MFFSVAHKVLTLNKIHIHQWAIYPTHKEVIT